MDAALIEELISSSSNLIQQFDIEFSRILMADYVHQDHDYTNNGHTDLETEPSRIAMELYIQQELEYVSNSCKVASELRKDLVWYQIQTETHVVVESGVETDMCAICQEDYEEGDSLCFLDCRHSFHSDCLTNWLVVNNTCPLCKSVGVPYIGR